MCSRNRLRSPTAETIFARLPGVDAASAGLDDDAVTPLSRDLVEWAHIVFVMERSHRNRLMKRFHGALRGKRVVVLDIPDDYAYMDPELVALLEAKLAPFLP